MAPRSVFVCCSCSQCSSWSHIPAKSMTLPFSNNPQEQNKPLFCLQHKLKNVSLRCSSFVSVISEYGPWGMNFCLTPVVYKITFRILSRILIILRDSVRKEVQSLRWPLLQQSVKVVFELANYSFPRSLSKDKFYSASELKMTHWNRRVVKAVCKRL